MSSSSALRRRARRSAAEANSQNCFAWSDSVALLLVASVILRFSSSLGLSFAKEKHGTALGLLPFFFGVAARWTR